MFINYSNHPSEQWEEKQAIAAEMYGEIMDIPFPNVPPESDEAAVQHMAEQEVSEILSYSPEAVLCQGEFTLSYQIIKRLLAEGVIVLAACSERVVIEEGPVRKSVFRFVRFREYL